MESNVIIPKDVQETPAGPDGNGFLILDILASSIVGLDGEIYTRKNGKIFIAPEDDESD